MRETGRQCLHAALGMIIALLVYYGLLRPVGLFLIVVISGLVSILHKRIRLPFFSWFLDSFERDGQKVSFPGKGMFFLFVGSLLSIQLFDRDIALASIMILALGDSVSHLFGAKFGRLRNIFNWRSNKWYEGTLAGILAGFLGAVLFVGPITAFLGSSAAMAAEVVKIDFNDNTLDDNLVVPLVAGTAMLLVGMYL